MTTILEIDIEVKGKTIKKVLKRADAKLKYFVGNVFEGADVQLRVTAVRQLKVSTWLVTCVIEEKQVETPEHEQKKIHLKYLVQGLKKK